MLLKKNITDSKRKKLEISSMVFQMSKLQNKSSQIQRFHPFRNPDYQKTKRNQ